MKIEQITDKITLICGDCMEYMKTLQDKAFDLIIADPPYGDGNFQQPPHQQAMSRDGGVVQSLQTLNGSGSVNGSTATSELRSLTGRFARYSRTNYPPPNYPIIKKLRKVFGGILLRARIILRSYSEYLTTRLFGEETTSDCHLRGAF